MNAPRESWPDRPMLICEELFLLLTNDAGTLVRSRSIVSTALTAGLVADAVELGRVALTADRTPKVVVVNATPTAVPAVDAALPRLAFGSGRSAKATVSDRQLNPQAKIVERLLDRGIIRQTEPRWGGVVPPRYPTVDATLEGIVRARLRAGVLGAPLAWHDATLLALVAATGAARSVFSLLSHEIGTAKLERRLDEVSRHVPLAQAVRSVRRTRDASDAASGLLLVGMIDSGSI